MIVKSYTKDKTEIYLTQDLKGSYNVVKRVEGHEPEFQAGFSYEDADELFDYFYDMILENDKTVK